MSAGAFGCDVAHRQVEHREAALRLPDARRELDAAEVAVVGVRRDRRVSPSTGSGARDSTRSTSPWPFTKTVAVNRPGSVNENADSDLSACGRAVALFFIAAFSTPCGVIHSWWMRSETKRGPGSGAVGELVPRERAADVLVVALLAGVRIAAAPQGLAAHQHDLVAHRAGLVVHACG